MVKLSLIIVTYNSSKHIYDCLDSVFTYNDIGNSLEVIIVDNNSQEQSMMFNGVRAKYGDKVVLINSGKNGGYGYGNNFGVRMASSPIVIVMNPDVRLIAPIFSKLLIKMEDKSIGVLGVSFVDGSNPFYIKPEKVSIWNELIHFLRIKLKMYNEGNMYMSGSFLVFNKDAFMKTSGFDENIFMYTEEPDITNRLQHYGYHAIWCPNFQVRHLAHGRGFNKITADMTYQSLKYYFNKYNADLIENIRTRIRVLQIKKYIAKILKNWAKLEEFEHRIAYLKLILMELVKDRKK